MKRPLRQGKHQPGTARKKTENLAKHQNGDAKRGRRNERRKRISQKSKQLEKNMLKFEVPRAAGNKNLIFKRTRVKRTIRNC